ncbi:hypothetical protein MesoLjLc_51550 [Mesorhizobium sp. L-8-10]|uniref:LAGLIDADG family homing endonuclease n=1 Tax=Mesorhizobium sp. L-8-10 TaxID=2744523 RepID=UPI0019288BB0|nr:LAGLIDADG family homing endonuclease [Mesorhizobium sp. L-8-10]BCH33225.1 hypothetical protein MesoLjLc_51550 [Mesorhizobium sp. L-8-10]
MNTQQMGSEVEFRHFHMFCGLGGGAKGFNKGTARVGQLRGRWRCIGGVDVDPGSIADFSRVAGVQGTVLDLFDEEQYRAFHGKAPPAGWRPATPADIRRAAHGERPHAAFLSAPCLPADGLVLTEDGARPISAISVGERVLSHRGRLCRVDRVNRRPYTGDMIGLRLNGTVDVQWYTDEHPIWVRRVRRDLATERKRALGDPSFVPAKDVRIGDRVGFPIETEEAGTAKAFVDGFGDPTRVEKGGKTSGRYAKPAYVATVERIVDLGSRAEDVGLWWLFGCYLGDGYRMHNSYRVAFCVGSEDGELAASVRSVVEGLGLSVYVDRGGGSTNVKLVVSSKHLHQLCGAFGDGAEKKALPPRLFRVERRFAQALIDGYRATDGSEQGARRMSRGNTLQARWKISSISLQLLRDVQRLLIGLGTFASIHHCWNGGEQMIEGRRVATRRRWELNVRLDPKKRTVFEFDDGAVWIRVRDILRRQTVEEVWNLEVAEDDTYCSPLIATHNCKGFSGLLPEQSSKTAKYQALNRLTLRGVWLMLEAWKDDPVELIVFENVPRIATRGRHLLDQIIALLRAYGYAVAETTHDCGELGGLGQSRKRFLLVARHEKKVPPFLYEPEKRRLRGVGEILERLPLPGDPAGGAMHRMPALQWKTWVRLAFVEAGSDWRSLNKLAVENGVLRDFGILPDGAWRDDILGVLPWDRAAPTVTAQAGATTGRFSVADPRVDGHPKSVQLGVRRWEDTAAVVKGDVSVGTGPYAVADPTIPGKPRFNNVFRIVPWAAASPAVAGPGGPAGGLAVADPRAGEGRHVNGKYRVTAFDEPANAVIGASTTGNGAFVVADPRPVSDLHKGAHGVRQWTDTSGTVQGESLPSNGAFAVADPRPGKPTEDLQGNWHITPFDEPAHAVVGNRKSGASAVADPRTGYGPNSHRNKLKVVGFEQTAGTVTGSDRVGSGALSVADPRPAAFGEKRDNYQTGGHYGVVPWGGTAYAVPGFAKHDRGNWSVADPREVEPEPIIELPKPEDRLVAVIRALDGTWHRPFTTLELAALQSLVDPDEVGTFVLEGQSDSAWRERIGNAVPPDAAESIAGVMATTLLLAMTGETFMLSSQPIWVQPVALALAVDQRGNIPQEDL